ncbi:MAG: serine hydrolase [Gemmatimonadales bacterium]|nr:serine hydrolase [Gemmatimonadales bacterium]
MVTRSLLVAAGVFIVAGCGGGSPSGPTPPPPPPPPPAAPVATVTVTVPTGDLYPGMTVSAAAEARTSAGATVSTSFTWGSSAPAVATVSGTGVITAVGAGTATITATSGTVNGTAQVEVKAPNLDRIVDSIRLAHNMPGMAGAIVTLDEIQAGVGGFRRAGGTVRVTIDDKWHIGSNLKAQTGALAAIAVDRGDISWSAKAVDWFPEWSSEIRAEFQNVTLEDLLANRSGIRNDPGAAQYAAATAREQRELVARYGLTNPGAVAYGNYFYSNVGFVIAGAMIERAMGGTYEALMQQHLWGPLGVNGAGWGPQALAGSQDQPVAHRWQNNTWVACEACDNPPGLSAAGRAHMPIRDWARVIQEMMKADGGSGALISATNGRHLTTGITTIQAGSTDLYAIGWITTTRTWANGRTVTHSGSNTINHSVAWVGLGRGLAVIAATNGYDTGGRTGTALDVLVSRMLNYYNNGK